MSNYLGQLFQTKLQKVKGGHESVPHQNLNHSAHAKKKSDIIRKQLIFIISRNAYLPSSVK